MAGRSARGAQRDRSRSQHFLRTGALASELVRDACVGPEDLVLDLGAGSGRLTTALARRAGHVVAVEIDPRWAAHLRRRWPNVSVIEGDAAAIVLPTEPFRVVANLPFDSATQILRRLLDDPRTPLVRADVVVEWGVALKRAMPFPSTLNDVLWGAWYRFTLVRRLPPCAFDPSPGVHAGVLAIARRSVSLVAEESWQAYRGFVASGFRRGIRGAVSSRVIKRFGIAGAAPRDLDAYQWAELFREQSS